MRRWRVLALALALGSGSACDRISELREKLLGSSGSADQEPMELTEARELYRAGQFQQAIQRLETFTQKERNSAQGFYYLGLSYMDAGGDSIDRASPMTPEEEKSLEAFNRALALNPRHALAAVGLGDLYFRRLPARRSRRRNSDPAQDPFQLAGDAYEKAVAIDPKLPEAQTGYAVWLERVGQTEEAEQAFKSAAAAAAPVPEKAPDIYIAYGRFLARQPGRMQEAVDQYELAQMFRQDDLELQGEIAALHTRVGQEYFDNEQYALAEQALNSAYELFPDKNHPEAQKAAATLKELRAIRAR